MKRGMYLVSCPVCGKVLCRSRVCQFEMQCVKCRSNLLVEILNQRMTIVEISSLGEILPEENHFSRRRGEAMAG